MKRFAVLVTVLVVALATVIPAMAATSRPPKIDLNAQRATYCPDVTGRAIVDVTMRVVNNGDSAVHGNTWANDRYVKRVRVWNRTGGGYCAQVSYTGSFVTLAGDSPNGTGTVAAGIKGKMSGGYIMTFDGDFAPTRNTKGSLGFYDFRCGDDYNVCKAYSVFTAMFENFSNDNMVYWAWNYTTTRHGWWHNGSDVNTGDIN